MWLQHKSFNEIISSWWNIYGWAAYRFLQKLKFIKQNLKKWNKDVFGSLTQQKTALSQQIERLDIEESALGLSKEDLRLRNKLKEELLDIVYKEEISWKQKSRLHWLEHGDANTSFFHKVSDRRKARNFISLLNINGSLVEEQEQIEKHLVDLFKALFSKKPQVTAWFEKWEGQTISVQPPLWLEREFTIEVQSILSKKPQVTAWFEKWEEKTISEQPPLWLEWEFTIEDIKSTIFSLPNAKAPGPHVFLSRILGNNKR